MNIHWKDWCWSWNSNTLATWCEELTQWKRPWYWERLKAGGEGCGRGWDGWMASPTWWTWVWESSRSWWWTGKPGLLQSIVSQRVRHDWATELTGWILCVRLRSADLYKISLKQGAFSFPFLFLFLIFCNCKDKHDILWTSLFLFPYKTHLIFIRIFLRDLIALAQFFFFLYFSLRPFFSFFIF